MKNITTLILAILCFALMDELKAQNAGSGLAEASKTKAREYILEVPKMESLKLLPLFLERIHTKETVRFKGFCQSRNLLFFESGDISLNEVLKILDELGLKYYLKEGVSIHNAINTCGSRTEVEESLKQDLIQSSGHE